MASFWNVARGKRHTEKNQQKQHGNCFQPTFCPLEMKLRNVIKAIGFSERSHFAEYPFRPPFTRFLASFFVVVAVTAAVVVYQCKHMCMSTAITNSRHMLSTWTYIQNPLKRIIIPSSRCGALWLKLRMSEKKGMNDSCVRQNKNIANTFTHAHYFLADWNHAFHSSRTTFARLFIACAYDMLRWWILN